MIFTPLERGLVTLAAVLAAAGYTYRLGYSHGTTKVRAEVAAQNAVVQEARDAMIEAAATAISGIEVRHTTINRKLEKEVRLETVYRDPGCQHSDAVFSLLNDALDGRTTSQPAGTGSVSGESGRALGQELRGNDP